MGPIADNIESMRKILRAVGIPEGAKVTRIVLDFQVGDVARAYVQQLVYEDAGAVIAANLAGVEVIPITDVAIDERTGDVFATRAFAYDALKRADIGPVQPCKKWRDETAPIPKPVNAPEPKCEKCRGTGVVDREEPFTDTVYDAGGMLCHVTGTRRYEVLCGCHVMPYGAWMNRLRRAEVPPPTGNPGGDAVG